MARIPLRYVVHDGVATATAIAAAIDVSNFKNVVYTIIPSSDFAGTVKFQGALRKRDTDAPVDFFQGTKLGPGDGTAANPWMYVEVIDMEDGSAIDGDTGVAFTAGSIRMVEANINALDWMGVHITARTAGTVTVIAHLSTNE